MSTRKDKRLSVAFGVTGVRPAHELVDPKAPTKALPVLPPARRVNTGEYPPLQLKPLSPGQLQALSEQGLPQESLLPEATAPTTISPPRHNRRRFLSTDDAAKLRTMAAAAQDPKNRKP